MSYTIRRASADDVVQVHSLLCELTEKDLDPALFRQHYIHNLKSALNIYLVATWNSEVAGFLSCHGQTLLHHMGTVYEIQEMIVRSDHRSRGVGKLLLDALDGELAQTEYKLVEVTSSTRRTATHRFYLANGFRQTHHKFTKPAEQSCA